MAEYNGITYMLQITRTRADGKIEADVQFNRNSIYRYCTFVFDTYNTSEYHNRCQKKIDKFIEKRQRKRTYEEIGEALYIYFTETSNTTLTKAQAIAWYTENIAVEGAI